VKTVIVIQKGEDLEVWNQLSKLCKAKGWSYGYARSKKFPYTYKGYTLKKENIR